MSYFDSAITGPPIKVRERGQSNTGSTLISNIPETHSFNNKINGVFIGNPNSLNWETLELGVNNIGWPQSYWGVNPPDIQQTLYGNEMPLMQLLVDGFNRNCYLYKYGWGGSGLGFSGQGANWLPSANGIYTDSNTCFTTLKNKLKVSDPIPQLDIWIQGESNINDPGTYAARLTALRLADIAFYGKTNHFLIVSLSINQTALDSSNILLMRAAQKSIAQFVHNIDGSTTIQSGGAVLPLVHYLEQNELCENQSGIYIHYNYQAHVNNALRIYKIAKDHNIF